jgi:hypothetical protein
MKKIIASAVGLVLVGGVAITNAAAVESQFGGYWRTRMFFQDDFVQNAANENDSSFNRTDNRTRLYYTAKFSDNFKFVNKFEFNSNWGDTNGGDLGADGNTFVVKNSYADFTLGMVNTKLGIQGAVISRGFIFDNDFSGVVVTADLGGVKVPFLYAAGPMDDVNGTVDNDTHILSTMPNIKISDSLSLTPHVTFANVTEDDTYVYFIGADIDMKMDAFSAWGTFIYNGGEIDNGAALPTSDISAWLVAAGAEAGIVHGQAFYATGDDDATDNDVDAFVNLPGTTSYYWSEIMGLGVFDNSASQGAPGDQISNIAAFNVGVTVKPMDKLKFDFDVWYAFLAEDNAAGEDQLGLEFDTKLTYALMDNLNAEFVFAYLVADDATGDEDVMEGGVRVSLSF